MGVANSEEVLKESMMRMLLREGCRRFDGAGKVVALKTGRTRTTQRKLEKSSSLLSIHSPKLARYPVDLCDSVYSYLLWHAAR